MNVFSSKELTVEDLKLSSTQDLLNLHAEFAKKMSVYVVHDFTVVDDAELVDTIYSEVVYRCGDVEEDVYFGLDYGWDETYCGEFGGILTKDKTMILIETEKTLYGPALDINAIRLYIKGNPDTLLSSFPVILSYLGQQQCDADYVTGLVVEKPHVNSCGFKDPLKPQLTTEINAAWIPKHHREEIITTLESFFFK